MPSAPAKESPTCKTLVPAGAGNEGAAATGGAVTGDGAGLSAEGGGAVAGSSSAAAAGGVLAAAGAGGALRAEVSGAGLAPAHALAKAEKSATCLNPDERPFWYTGRPFIRAFPPGQRGGD